MIVVVPRCPVQQRGRTIHFGRLLQRLYFFLFFFVLRIIGGTDILASAFIGKFKTDLLYNKINWVGETSYFYRHYYEGVENNLWNIIIRFCRRSKGRPNPAFPPSVGLPALGSIS